MQTLQAQEGSGESRERKGLRHRIAEHLLNIGAVELRPEDPFTWTSGIRAPIYCDNRLIISYPEIREEIADSLVRLIREHFPDVQVIAGAATAGIPHAAWVAQKMNLPMVYVRSKPKGHGKGTRIEGRLQPGGKVVVIEDLISTGGSSLNVAKAIQEEGGIVLGVCAIFTYQLRQSAVAFAEAKLPLYALSDYSALAEVALQKGIITDADLEGLERWREDPENYFKKA